MDVWLVTRATSEKLSEANWGLYPETSRGSDLCIACVNEIKMESSNQGSLVKGSGQNPSNKIINESPGYLGGGAT